MEIAIALFTILTPLLSVWAASWADKIKKKQQEKPYADIDTSIAQSLGGDQAGLVNLSLELERLQHKAASKRHSAGQ